MGLTQEEDQTSILKMTQAHNSGVSDTFWISGAAQESGGSLDLPWVNYESATARLKQNAFACCDKHWTTHQIVGADSTHVHKQTDKQTNKQTNRPPSANPQL